MKILEYLYRLINIPSLFRAFCEIERARNLLVLSDPQNAELVFENAEKELLRIAPEGKYYYHPILKGLIKFHLEKRAECYSIFKKVYKDLDTDRSFPIADKQYLQAFIYEALRIYSVLPEFNIDDIRPVFMNDVPIDKVSSLWKRRFPYKIDA